MRTIPLPRCTMYTFNTHNRPPYIIFLLAKNDNRAYCNVIVVWSKLFKKKLALEFRRRHN